MKPGKPDNKFEILKETTARVIFYSCLAEAKSLSEIAKLWGYKTPTYFYQSKTKKMLKKMEQAGLITIERRKGIKSALILANYDVIFSQEDIDEFFIRVNKGIAIHALLEDAQEKITGNKSRKKYFEKRFKPLLERILFTDDSIAAIVDLWKDPYYRKFFLDPELLTRTREKKEISRAILPEDPKDLLYEITASLCYETYSFRRDEASLVSRGSFSSYLIPPTYIIKREEVLDYMVSKYNAISSKESEGFGRRFKKVYEIFVKRYVTILEMFTLSRLNQKRVLYERFFRLIGLNHESP